MDDMIDRNSKEVANVSDTDEIITRIEVKPEVLGVHKYSVLNY